MTSRYSKVRQIGKDQLVSTFLVEDRLHHGRFFGQKIFKSSTTLHSENISQDIQSASPDSPKPDLLDLLSKLTELRHPFCAQYHEVYVQSGVVHAITEHAYPGRFDFLINECGRANEQFDEALVLRWIAQLCMGLIYLEDNNIFLTRLPIVATALFNGCCAKLTDIEVRFHQLWTHIHQFIDDVCLIILASIGCFVRFIALSNFPQNVPRQSITDIAAKLSSII